MNRSSVASFARLSLAIMVLLVAFAAGGCTPSASLPEDTLRALARALQIGSVSDAGACYGPNVYHFVNSGDNELTRTYTNAEIRQVYQDLLNAHGSDFFENWNVKDMERIPLAGDPRPDEACIRCYTPWHFNDAEGWSDILTTYWLERVAGTWYITQEYYYFGD